MTADDPAPPSPSDPENPNPHRSPRLQIPETPPPREPSTYRKTFLIIATILAIASALYRVLEEVGGGHSAAMFIGLPYVLAVLLCFAPASRTATGSIMRGITLFLLLLGILAIEGFICILVAAPLFYSIGFIVGIFVDRGRKQRDMSRFRVIAAIPLAVMSLEGLTGALSFDRNETVEVSLETPLDARTAELRLAQGPELALKELPVFLKLGFPQPMHLSGSGLSEGNTWTIHFEGGEGEPGDLKAVVTQSQPGHYLVSRVSDTSHISHWVDWKDAEWTIEPVGNHSVVHLKMRYSRLLDPAWYFRPLERYGVRKAGEYFLAQTFAK